MEQFVAVWCRLVDNDSPNRLELGRDQGTERGWNYNAVRFCMGILKS